MGLVVLFIVAPASVLISERSSWLTVGPAILLVFALGEWLRHKEWEDKEQLATAALLSYGLFFIFRLIDAAAGNGGWGLFDKMNLVIYAWSFTAWFLFGSAKWNREKTKRM